MERTTVYFEDSGSGNTGEVFRLVQDRLKDSNIGKVVLASTTGDTARQALGFFGDKGVKLIVIPHQYDFIRETNPFPPDLAGTLREAGHEVHFATMLFHTDGLYGTSRPTLIANVLRCFSQGVKVCFEIVLMATDAGLLERGETIIAVAGTGRGSDTALVMQAASSQHMNRLRVNEIICKPLNPLSLEELKERMGR
jgi:uncharacterized protein